MFANCLSCPLKEGRGKKGGRGGGNALFNAPFIGQNRSSIDAKNSLEWLHFWPLSTRFYVWQMALFIPCKQQHCGVYYFI